MEIDGEKKPGNMSLTALMVIALAKSRQEDRETLREVTRTRNAAATYLSLHSQDLDDPFEMAIVTYALSVADHPGKSVALRRLKELKRTSKRLL